MLMAYAIWINKFEESTKTRYKFSSSFLDDINYIFKTDHHAQKHRIGIAGFVLITTSFFFGLITHTNLSPTGIASEMTDEYSDFTMKVQKL